MYSIDIKASRFSYWLRLQHETVNPLLKEAFHHARNHSQFFDILNNDETIRMHSTSNTSGQQPFKNARSSIKKQLKKDYIRNWLRARNNTSECSREKFTHILGLLKQLLCSVNMVLIGRIGRKNRKF